MTESLTQPLITDDTVVFGLLALCLGFVVFLLINMIPIVGGLFMFLAALAAAGAAFLSRFGKKETAA